MDEDTVLAYLSRIALTPPVAADAAALRVLHRAHLVAVPFENLSIHLSEPISLDEPGLVDKIVRKHLDLKAARRTVFLLKELGMTVHGTFTQGLPGETPEQVQDTHRYIASLPLDSFQLSGTASIEGTPLASLEKAGRLERYPLAQVDGNYTHETDGQKKVEAMRH